MLKHILVAAALLVPALAYGADLSVQIVPAASPPPSPPLSPPPTGLTPPPGAQAAGFTTLALNMDFTGATTSSYAGTTYNINDLSDSNSWLSCQYATGGGNTPTHPVWWVSPAWGNAAPCSRVSIINDGGTNVLDIQWQPNDGPNLGVNASEIDTWTVNESANTGYSFPLGGSYIEFVFRETPATISACPAGGGACLDDDVWSWPTSGGSTEWDFLETYANGFGAPAVHGDSNASSVPAWGFLDYTQYRTFGLRMTTDGTHMDQCGYLDTGAVSTSSSTRTFFGCGGEFTANDGTSTTEQRSFLRLQVGPVGGSPWPTENMDMYLQRITVWSCSSWQTSPCTGTVLTGAP
jgi:hypothetical protein